MLMIALSMIQVAAAAASGLIVRSVRRAPFLFEPLLLPFKVWIFRSHFDLG